MNRFFIALCLGVLIASFGTAQPQDIAAKPAVSTADRSVTESAITTPTLPTVPSTITEPKYTGEVFLLVGGKLLPLEKQGTDVQTGGTRAFGLAGYKGAINFNGKASPVRVSEPEFVFRMDGPGGMSPALLVDLKPLKVGKNNRELVTISMGSPLLLKKAKVGGGAIQLNVTEYGEHSVKLTPATRLEPGEYAITLKNVGMVAFLFGVD